MCRLGLVSSAAAQRLALTSSRTQTGRLTTVFAYAILSDEPISDEKGFQGITVR
jgi:hypothetical protein